MNSEWSTALLLDLRGARGGRLKEKRLRGIFRTWHSLDRTISLLIDDDELVRMRTERLVAEIGDSNLRTFVDEEDALAWARIATQLKTPVDDGYAAATAS